MRTSHLIILTIALATLAMLVPMRRESSGEIELLMTVWGMPFEDRLFRDAYARGFEAEHPGVTVRYERYADNPAQKYFAWNLLGNSADVMRVRITDYHALVEGGVLAPLDQFIHDPQIGLSAEEFGDYFPAIIDQLRVDGSIFALPSDNAQYGLYYNKSLFDEYNASHSDSPLEYPSAEWTWGDLNRAAEALTIRDEQSGRIVQYGIGFDLWAWPFMAFLRQTGGKLWDEDKTSTLIASAEGVEALKYLVALIPPDAPIRSPDLADAAGGPSALFVEGRQAMLLDGSWRAPWLEGNNPDLDFAVAPLPHFRRRAIISGSVLWAVGAHSRHKAHAWRMVKWMTNREQSLRYWDTLRVAPPARVSVVKSDGFKSTSGLKEGDEVRVPPMSPEAFEDRAAWIVYGMTPLPESGEAPAFVPVGVYQADLEDKITGALVAAVRGAMTPAEALERAARQMHTIIDRDRAAKSLPPIIRE